MAPLKRSWPSLHQKNNNLNGTISIYYLQVINPLLLGNQLSSETRSQAN